MALAAVLALNGISILPVGDKMLMVFTGGQTNRAAALLARNTVASAATANQPLPAGALDFRGADLSQAVAIYEQLCGHPVELDADLPKVNLTLKNQTSVSPAEALRALDLLLGWHGLKVVKQGEGKPLKLVRFEETQKS